MIWWACSDGILKQNKKTKWLITGHCHIIRKLHLTNESSRSMSISNVFWFTSSIDISSWKQEYGVILFMVAVIFCMRVWNNKVNYIERFSNATLVSFHWYLLSNDVQIHMRSVGETDYFLPNSNKQCYTLCTIISSDFCHVALANWISLCSDLKCSCTGID